MTAEADLLEAASTIVFTVESIWSTVGMIAQASDDSINWCQKWRLATVTSSPELSEGSLDFVLIQ